MEEIEKSITLTNDKGDEAIVVDNDATVVSWAARGYFSKEARAKIKESKATKGDSKEAETQMVPAIAPDLSVDVGADAEAETEATIKPSKKRK